MVKTNIKPFYFQSAAHDCVPASVMALAHYYRITINIRQLRSVLITDPSCGTELRNLNNLAPWFKVQLGRIVNLSEIQTYTPFIAYLVHNHAIVVWSHTEDGKRLMVGDPAIGLVEMRLGELQKVWEGIAVVLRPLDEGFSIELASEVHSIWSRWFHIKELRAFQINWWSMAWGSSPNCGVNSSLAEIALC